MLSPIGKPCFLVGHIRMVNQVCGEQFFSTFNNIVMVHYVLWIIKFVLMQQDYINTQLAILTPSTSLWSNDIVYIIA